MSGTRQRSAFEIANGLHWVRGEIDASLARARVAIERHLDASEAEAEPQALDEAATELRLVHGSLAMIECFGAGALAQEMVRLLEALIAGRAKASEEAFSALSGATLQLSDYVDLLAHGAADRVLVLQPVINELRLAGGQPLSTEAELFARQLKYQSPSPPPPAAPAAAGGAVQALARRELVAFQTAFLQWFRGQDAGAGLERMGRIADLIAVNAESAELREFWSGCAALVECLRLQSPDSLDLKRLYGRAGSQLKLLAEGGEAAALDALGDAPRQVLFHIAGAPRTSARAQALIAGLKLDVLLPPLEQIAELRQRLRGPGTTILDRVYEEIRRDFTQLKDTIDLAVRTRGRTSADLGGTRERLRRLAQTVGALGLPAAQKALLNQAAAVAELAPGDLRWMGTATAILRIEHSLEEALFRALGRSGAPARDYAEIEAEVPHGRDLRESVAALVRECLVEFAQLKSGVDAYLKRGETTALTGTPQRLHEISAVLKVLGAERASQILAQLHRYVDSGRLAALKPSPGEFERFADAVSCAEVYFEALRDGLPSPERVLDDVAAYVERLDIEPAAAESVTGPSPPALPVVVSEPPHAAAPASAPPSAGIDPEIREVFLEEAGEVRGTVARGLGQLRRNPADREALVEVRRAFHTLKGSGRMAGALRVGEFSWAVEALLNRCLEGALAVRTPVLELLDEASAILPRLLENFRDGGEDDRGAATLMARAARLAAGGSASEPDLLAVFREDARDRLGFVRRWLEAQNPSADGFPIEPEVLRAFHTLRGSAAVINAQAVNQLAALLEDYFNSLRIRSQALPPQVLILLADALVTLKQWVESASVGDAHLADLADWRARIDQLQVPMGAPAIDEAFCVEALDRLQGFETEIRRWARVPMMNLAGSLRAGFAGFATQASAAGATGLGAVAQAMAATLADWPATAVRGSEFFSAALEVIEGLYQQLDAYREGAAEAGAEQNLARVKRLPAPPAVPAVAASPLAVDFELQEIFAAEATEILQALARQHAAWVGGDAKATAELRRELHTLKGSARTTGAFALGDAAARLEEKLDEPAASGVGALQAELAAGIVELHRLHGSVAPLEFAAPGEVRPSATPSDEPAVPISGIELSLDSIVEASFEGSAGEPSTSGVLEPDAETDSAIKLDFDAPEKPDAPATPEPGSIPDTSAPLRPIAAPMPEPAAMPAAAPVLHLDHELTEIFAAEAVELLEQLDVGLEAWQNGDAGEPLREVQRALHTLKGGARMAGLEAMGDAVHEFEGRVNAASAAGEIPDGAEFARLRDALDELQGMHDQVRRGEAALLMAPKAPQGPEPAAVAAPGPSLAGWAPQLFWRPDEELAGLAAARRETARVAVESLDAMLNQAGEISIYRSRLEEHNAGLRAQLAEVTQTIVRVRDQLRMLDIETEAQIAARGLSGSELGRSGDRYGQDFDPLEMDRFSRMQELSRALAESVNDLAVLQTAMDESVGETDTLLLQQSRINTEVQQGLMGTLMVPFSRQAPRLARVVRQTAQENGKQAEAQFRGVEAELDRKVLERITAPLEHLLRNAVVHGIEDPAGRALAGKPLVGAISVSLHREGGQLLLEVGDDGAGLDLAAIRAKAVERGLLAAEVQLSDGDLARFIFEPGFTTARRLSQDAGRGIGMDVVSSEVKQLGGTLELRSEAGTGTRFLLRLPLTLAVSQALMIGVGHETYAVPLPSIDGIARIPRAELAEFARDGGPLYPYGGRGYRVRHLAEYLGLPRTEDPEARSVIAILVRLGDDVGGGERRVALLVEQLFGNREVVSKATGPQVSSVPGVAGATLLADGRVVLILDLPALIAEHARRALLSQAGAVDAIGAPAVEARDTIMVVDDSVTMRRVAERLLTRNGYRVITARDGLDAIALLQSETPSALLLDIEMPRADGFEVAAFVRNTPRLKRLPIVIITSRSGEKHRERARALGVDRYLIKPYQEDQLLSEIRSLRAEHVA